MTRKLLHMHKAQKSMKPENFDLIKEITRLQ